MRERFCSRLRRCTFFRFSRVLKKKKTLRTILDPKKTLANGAALLGNLLPMSCFLGHGPPCEGPPLPKTTLCGIPRCVVVLWCGVSVRCVLKIFVGASKIWALPPTPSAGPPPPTLQPPKFYEKTPRERKRAKMGAGEGKKGEILGCPAEGGPRGGSPKAGVPKGGGPEGWGGPKGGCPEDFALFFPSPATIFILSSSWGSFRGIFGGVIEGRDPQMCTFGLTGCRVKPRWLLQNVKNNFTIDLPSPQDFRKINDQSLQILVVSRKKKPRTQPNEIPREDASPHLHCFWVVVCAVCNLLLVCFSCCLCSCCGLLLPLFLLLLVLVAAFWAADR